MKNKFAKLLVSATIVGMFGASSAMAGQLTSGQINTGGIVTLLGTQGKTLDQATGLDFINPLGVSGAGALVGVTGSGAFANMDCTAAATRTGCGSISDILDFSTFTNTNDFIVTVGGVSFQLNAPLSITRAAAGQNNLATLILSGSGLVRYGSFDATPGVFTLVTQGTNIEQTTFSASIVTTPAPAVVPEPASLMLLGIGLLGAVAGRRKKN